MYTEIMCSVLHGMELHNDFLSVYLVIFRHSVMVVLMSEPGLSVVM